MVGLGHFGNNGREYLRKDNDSIIEEIIRLKSLPFTPKRKLKIQKLQQKNNKL